MRGPCQEKFGEKGNFQLCEAEGPRPFRNQQSLYFLAKIVHIVYTCEIIGAKERLGKTSDTNIHTQYICTMQEKDKQKRKFMVQLATVLTIHQPSYWLKSYAQNICSKPITQYSKTTGNMRQLVVVRRICCCSQFMIFYFFHSMFTTSKQHLAAGSTRLNFISTFGKAK